MKRFLKITAVLILALFASMSYGHDRGGGGYGHRGGDFGNGHRWVQPFFGFQIQIPPPLSYYPQPNYYQPPVQNYPQPNYYPQARPQCGYVGGYDYYGRYNPNLQWRCW
jgi:hypothetical protein